MWDDDTPARSWRRPPDPPVNPALLESSAELIAIQAEQRAHYDRIRVLPNRSAGLLGPFAAGLADRERAIEDALRREAREAVKLQGGPGRTRPVVLHIPHASQYIPYPVRRGILLSDAQLERELVRLTDHLVDELLHVDGATRVIGYHSRLVVDPERFEDDALEPMARVGQGAVYTRGTDGREIRRLTPARRRQLIDRYFTPYHDHLTRMVDEVLERDGRCLVIDGHSFATKPLPSEADQQPDRPDICIGTDPFHTPPALVDALRTAFEAERFRVAVDTPFAGTMVPQRHYRSDARVRSVMLEIRRGLYCRESTGLESPDFHGAWMRIHRAVEVALDAWGEAPLG